MDYDQTTAIIVCIIISMYKVNKYDEILIYFILYKYTEWVTTEIHIHI